MKKFDYNDVSKKIGWDFSKMNYVVEQKHDFNYYKSVVEKISPNTVMLDIGCGSAEKTARFYGLAKKVYFTDYEPEMLKRAEVNVEKYYENDDIQCNKFVFDKIDSRGSFKYSNESFDLVVSRHCGANMHEVYRVLKHGGAFISEDVSSDDCQELKDYFNRGQGYNEQPLYKKVMNECMDSGYSEIQLIKFEQIEYYKTIDDLRFLLMHTPILNGFDEDNDNKILDKYVKDHTTRKGIKLIRRLYAFRLIK